MKEIKNIQHVCFIFFDNQATFYYAVIVDKNAFLLGKWSNWFVVFPLSLRRSLLNGKKSTQTQGSQTITSGRIKENGINSQTRT